MKLYDLRTEYRENPIGLTDKAPRFSWKIESEEQNTIQTAYEINVTDEKSNVVWNSGKKASDQSVLISYEGEKLADEKSRAARSVSKRRARPLPRGRSAFLRRGRDHAPRGVSKRHLSRFSRYAARDPQRSRARNRLLRHRRDAG